MEKRIELKLLAKHFANGGFCNNNSCPVASAAKDHFGLLNSVSEQVSYLVINNKAYFHERYEAKDYDDDMEVAREHNFDDTLVRTILLIYHDNKPV